MKYKKSYYNIEVDKKIEDCVLIFNTVSCALSLMDDKTYTLYSEIDKFEYDENDSEDIKEILANGYIVPEDFDEFKNIELQHRFARYSASGALHITIAPTMKCNMQCPYCYEFKENKDMSPIIQEKLVEFLKNYLALNSEIKSLSIAWYGGEPLLKKDVIYKISEKVIKYCNENNIIYTSNIVTNGVLLDYNTAKTLKEQCLVSKAQITLDGMEKMNNKTRILKSKENSFEIITNNIEAIKDIMKVSVRMNVSKNNVGDCRKVVKYFNDKGWSEKVELYFSPVIAYENSSSETKKSCFTYEEFNDISIELDQALVNNKLKDNITYPINFFGCSALGVNSLVIDPEGNFCKCWHRINLPKYYVGNVYSGISLNKENMDWLMLDIPDKCKKCNTLPVCRCGCPEIRLNTNNSPTCDFPKEHVKELIYNYYQNMVENE